MSENANEERIAELERLIKITNNRAIYLEGLLADAAKLLVEVCQRVDTLTHDVAELTRLMGDDGK